MLYNFVLLRGRQLKGKKKKFKHCSHEEDKGSPTEPSNHVREESCLDTPLLKKDRVVVRRK